MKKLLLLAMFALSVFAAGSANTKENPIPIIVDQAR